MKTIFLTLFILTVASAKGFAQSDPFLPKVVDIAIGHAYIPQGFDSNDRTQFVVEGFLPNTCYRLAETETKFDESNNILMVRQKAYLYDGICLQVLVPFNRAVEFGILPTGSYKVEDAYSGQRFGQLPVAPSLNSGPDDDLYAIIEDAHLGVVNNERAILVRGNLPTPCWEIKEMKVIVESDDVITILPVMDYIHGHPELCTRVFVPFLKNVKIPATLKKGRYLVQVRSLNGQSVNKLFDL